MRDGIITKDSLQGSMTALVTPFLNGEVDWTRLDASVNRQCAAGTDWLVPCGTTGESPTLTEQEYRGVIEAVIIASAGRVPVMVGTGTNSTAETIIRTKSAKAAGADAALIVSPYYNKPSDEGLFRHYAAVADAVDLPIVLYNVPHRTACHISNEVIVRLVESHPNILAVKHATGSVDGVTELMDSCSVVVLSGDDQLTYPLMALGAKGVVSVVSNLVPSRMKQMVSAVLKGEFDSALVAHRKLSNLAISLAKFGPNPVPIKTAMALVGLIEAECRLPLCGLDDEAKAGIERVLRRHELLASLHV